MYYYDEQVVVVGIVGVFGVFDLEIGYNRATKGQSYQSYSTTWKELENATGA